jgi:CHAD domain-containing protein
MSFELKPARKPGRRVCRVMREQISGVIEHLENENGPEGESVHEARKGLKKSRAVVRMVQPGLQRNVYQRTTRRLRKAAQALSDLRDAEVLVKALAEFEPVYCEQALRSAIRKLEKAVEIRRGEILSTGGNWRKEVEARLKVARRETRSWPIGSLNETDLFCGIKKMYRRGREGLEQAGLARKNENLHEWRKRVKDLWYQLRLLEPYGSRKFALVVAELKQLGENLGDDHDLAMLEEAAQGVPMKSVELEKLVGAMAARRQRLQKAAFKLGRRLYARKTRQFEQWIEEVWRQGKKRS